ncbi:MAG: PTS IIA-like nitrogen regulatory protein PtsN [Shewanella psychromarinicola]|jgi:PTS system nitrogen regulatory IIA component|uniref:PTS IIA-like nitrogen-regulatory protein PtsN n=1 Tax=Shewanella psychromarinicola TaxID=2487742 RepID=A0A3N4EHH5_9GAMM|nr:MULTISPECIES: PTS IIA-like nitrogen regulatory protein PtsN [Shewanella]AZG34857.1 PTS IIA-like nitrogen-regulatory protein PtsN [Shewanella psychromarinicola]MCL1083961.1 PTS IIA-like nitrogen regulatory protein PtsN [Shewanella psychromarinicola]PKG79800.1 PTS IIA-like nitrogen-regulatory protein PtsN [Shewanella sp. Actino-trap-3]RPA33351.1 PTS IIA-like nitrogen-regulatory protein PtsN [Shewanella psychromarinicola]|tara:strand:+ start:15780 stop:16223 length:444 start_codon:yes stop_codon:yes gene_type:complete
MELCTILQPECTTCATPGSKKKVLELISNLVAAQYPTLSSQEVFESLLAREKMGSTGIGNGIAIPHGRLTTIDHPIAIFVKCEEAIAFDAIDKQPVDILFALLVPADQCQQHLGTLSSMAKKLSDKQILKQLRKSHNATELYRVITA